MTRSIILTTALLLAAIAAPALTSSAHAAPVQGDERQITVSYADLNLTTPAGNAILAARVKAAAVEICGQPDSLNNVAAGQRFKACMTKTVADTMAKVSTSTIVAGVTRPLG